MADLPPLTKSQQRKLAVQAKSLIVKYDFTRAQFGWHDAARARRQRRREQGEGGWNSGTADYPEYADDNSDWGDPDFVDHIGIGPTANWAKERFEQELQVYYNLWATAQMPDSDQFLDWTRDIQSAVVSEAAALWNGGTLWHREWYEQSCRKLLEDLLTRTAGIWVEKARQFEIKSLEDGEAPAAPCGATSRGATAEPGRDEATPAVSAAGNGTERRSAVDRFILKCQQDTSLRVTRKQMWLAAGYKAARQFQLWQAADKNATAQAGVNFRRILAMSPADFEALLKKKHLI